MKKHVLLCIITLPTSHALCMHLSEKQKTKEIIAFESTVNQLFKQVYKEARNDSSIRSHNPILALQTTTFETLKNTPEIRKHIQFFGQKLLEDEFSYKKFHKALQSVHKKDEINKRKVMWNNFHIISRFFLIQQITTKLPSLTLSPLYTLHQIIYESRKLPKEDYDIFLGGFITIVASIELQLLHDPESYS